MKYCEKHNQEFYDYVPECPICAGEKMSAIVAGKKCKKCGEEYFYSFGMPTWYTQQQKDSAQWKSYMKIRKAKLCQYCAVKYKSRVFLRIST